MKTNWLVCFSELYRNKKTRVRESHQPNYRYDGLTHCQMRKRKWLTGFREFYRDFLIARVPESISQSIHRPILKRVNN